LEKLSVSHLPELSDSLIPQSTKTTGCAFYPHKTAMSHFLSENNTICGIFKEDRQNGYAQLSVFTSPETTDNTRKLFLRFVEDHLTRTGVERFESLTFACNCGYNFDAETLLVRRKSDKVTVQCPRCDAVHSLIGLETEQQALMDRAEAAALRQEAKMRTQEVMNEVSANMQQSEIPKTGRSSLLRLLHLSDLHLSADSDPIVLIQPLLDDIKSKRVNGLGVEKLDYMVISGDLTNRGSDEEFAKAHVFISKILEEFQLSSDRCIIVPGNHDVNWDESVYEWRSSRNLNFKEFKEDGYRKQGDGYVVVKQDLYNLRFRNFAEKFYHPLLQREYPLEPRTQGISTLFPRTNCNFLVLTQVGKLTNSFQIVRA
jgi:hypothetical protein